MASCKDCFHCRACHEMYLIAVAQEDDFFERNDADTCEDFINTADVAEVKHGEWYVTEYEYLNCSICGEAMYTGCNSTQEANLLKDHWKSYCPNCGAKMDGGKKE